VAAIEAIDLVVDGGDGLGGANPVEHLLVDRRIVDLADDAVVAHARLAQSAIRGQQAHVAGELALLLERLRIGAIRPKAIDKMATPGRGSSRHCKHMIRMRQPAGAVPRPPSGHAGGV
jgi:hypothetical protein